MKIKNQRNFRTRILICGKFLIISFIFYCLCGLIITLLTREKPSEVNRCYMDAISIEVFAQNRSLIEDGDPIPLEDVLLAKDKPVPGKTIFLLETSCACSDPQFDLLTLNSRQACAVESAALHNPNLQVFVLFVCPTFRHQSDPITDAIISYKNVKLRHVNLWRFAEGTPVEDWVKKDDLFRSRYLVNNISNLLRLLMLYRYGGIYMDMDVVVLRSFEDETVNFLCPESKISITNAVIGLKPKGFGHKLGELFLRDFQNNYNGDIWTHNGPKSLSRVMSKICEVNNVSLMLDRHQCHGIKLFPINVFYEIRVDQWTHFFDPKLANETLERLNNSYLTHLWNSISHKRSLRVDSDAAYIQLAKQNCPKVLDATSKRFD
ncbi:lactosylceramide 4-alpha-galactosyltransferase-like [Drosophila innubila]|uniref:lactosylceramide 4-alpha-galactosyltransferase-like n=1 Tax=Drosophila innubila TaxID=198719 RepID=UPI00148D72BC|nr:lactosylceramide 4-alpha-galactosyltransferase-like [Drosophila innubila]